VFHDFDVTTFADQTPKEDTIASNQSYLNITVDFDHSAFNSFGTDNYLNSALFFLEA